jgi:hypothetical protein
MEPPSIRTTPSSFRMRRSPGSPYHEVTKQVPRVWITFEVDQRQELFLQIGVPVLGRLQNYRAD